MNYLLVVIKNNILDRIDVASTEIELERMFDKECSNYSVEALDSDYENGYIELECGTTICMTHVSNKPTNWG